MALLIAVALSLALTVEGATQTQASCPEKGMDQHSLLQTALNGGIDAGLDARSIAKTFEAAGLATRAEAGKLERSLRSLSDAATDVQAARDTTNAALGFESQSAESLKLAYQEAQQVEEMQQARAYQDANVTEILHKAVRRLEESAPFGSENSALLHSLRRAEAAQAAMLQDAAQEDKALTGLSSTMAAASQAATTAKLIDETQTSQTLDGAIAKLQAAQSAQLENAKDSVQLAKSLQALDGKEQETVQLLENAKAQETTAEELQKTNALLEAHLVKATSEKAAEQAALAVAQKEVQASQSAQQARAEAAAEHRKAELARQEATAMYQAAASTQAALEGQASKTAQSLFRVSAEASHAAQLLQGALGNTAAIH